MSSHISKSHLHTLQAHCIDFLRAYKIGLGLFGEQGGEETHAIINELKIWVWRVNNPADKIRILMKEHMTIVSPRLQPMIVRKPANKVTAHMPCTPFPSLLLTTLIASLPFILLQVKILVSPVTCSQVFVNVKCTADLSEPWGCVCQCTWKTVLILSVVFWISYKDSRVKKMSNRVRWILHTKCRLFSTYRQWQCRPNVKHGCQKQCCTLASCSFPQRNLLPTGVSDSAWHAALCMGCLSVVRKSLQTQTECLTYYFMILPCSVSSVLSI